jgi:hypothetical protein
MKITKRQLRNIINESFDQQSYDLGREDSLASINPQMSDEDYMMGYNEAQMDMGMPSVQPPNDSRRGKRLNPDDLKYAFPRGDARRNRPVQEEKQMKITKRQLRKIIKEEKRKLLEYSDYPSHTDLSDTVEDMYTSMEDVIIKYVESGWLSSQDQGSIARNLEEFFDNLNMLNNTLRAVSGDKFMKTVAPRKK